jgi:hypothetical protein
LAAYRSTSSDFQRQFQYAPVSRQSINILEWEENALGEMAARAISKRDSVSKWLGCFERVIHFETTNLLRSNPAIWRRNLVSKMALMMEKSIWKSESDTPHRANQSQVLAIGKARLWALWRNAEPSRGVARTIDLNGNTGHP